MPIYLTLLKKDKHNQEGIFLCTETMSLVIDNEDFFGKFPPILRENFQTLFFNGTIGLLQFTASDIIFIKTYNESNSVYYFHYNLKIPFAGHKLSWDLIFTPEDMSFAPNFNFNDDNFYLSEDLNVVVDNIPSLLNWNVNNPKALLSVLKEFLMLYKKQQHEKLQKENIYSDLCNEYQRLIDNVSPTDVELLLTNMTATIIVNIKVDISSLPEYTQELRDKLVNPGEDTCLLKISYVKLDGSKINTSIQLSARLKQVLETINVPPYSRATSLIDYVVSIRRFLQEQILTIEEHHKLKKIFLNTVCTKYAPYIIEFDAETFINATLMKSLNGFCYFIHIDIGKKFPKEMPNVRIQSIYCISSGFLCVEDVHNYPYCPRWSAENMLEKMMKYLKDLIPKFKNHKH